MNGLKEIFKMLYIAMLIGGIAFYSFMIGLMISTLLRAFG